MGAREKRALARLAHRYGLQILYAFGSRAREAFARVGGKAAPSPAGGSDLDIGVKPARPLSIDEKVAVAQHLEDLFSVPRVDLVVLPDADPFVALEAVKGELLYASDSTFEAEYQLYVMRRAAELLHFRRATERRMLGA